MAPINPYDPERRDKWVYGPKDTPILFPHLCQSQEHTMSTLYDTDFYAWTQAQAAAIRAKDLAALDLDHLAEEIEDLGRHDHHTIARQLQRLLMHLLKWHYQPSHRTPSWDTSIDEARELISDLIEASHSLRLVPTQRFERAYMRARRQAAKETGLPLTTFPEACPWTLADVLTEDWLPPEDP